MASAPAVENLQDIVARYTAAQQPQQQAIDQSIATNDSSGDAARSGIEAAKSNAFSGITQGAQNRGMFFSGFTPDAQAKYTAATYLPALAKLQTTIANTRDTLLGKKADLAATANTSAISDQKSEQSALDAWNAEQAKEAAAAAEAEKERQFTATQNALNRAASAKSSTPSAADQRASAIGSVNSFLQGLTGSDNYVSPTTYAQAKNTWVATGNSGKDFDSVFGAYRNPNNKYYKLG